jgi:hypothetical protein
MPVRENGVRPLFPLFFLYDAMVAGMINSLKGIPNKERSRRHIMMMDFFRKHDRERLPWMARISQNPAEPLLELAEHVREPVGIYTWRKPGDWFCVSINQVSQMRDGKLEVLEFGKGQIQDVTPQGDSISISGIKFSVPAEVSALYAEIIREVEASIESMSVS